MHDAAAADDDDADDAMNMLPSKPHNNKSMLSLLDALLLSLSVQEFTNQTKRQ